MRGAHTPYRGNRDPGETPRASRHATLCGEVILKRGNGPGRVVVSPWYVHRPADGGTRQVDSAKGSHGGVDKKAGRVDRGGNPLGRSGHLPDIVGLHNGEAGDVAAGPRKTLDQAATDRVGDDRENNGDGARLLQQRRHMPVLRDGKLTGIISIGDVVRHRLEDWCSQQSAAACMAAYARLRCRTMKAHADERAMCGGIPRACILASCLNNQAVLVLRAQPGAQSFARRRRARRVASTDQARAGRRSFETISNFGFVLSVPD